MKKTALSFEFFPPKTEEGIAKLRETRKKLAVFKPEFYSVTFGAGGSTRDRTMDTVFEMQDEGYQAAPHISCISSSKAEIVGLLKLTKTKALSDWLCCVAMCHQVK
jgi:5,10-methylenetetrahydrofolate reductase